VGLPDERTVLIWRPSSCVSAPDAAGHLLGPIDMTVDLDRSRVIAVTDDEPTICLSRREARTQPRSGLVQLLTIASSFLGTQLVTSALGALFWSLTARSYPVAQVGVGSAAISSMNVLGTVGMLGLGTLLMTRLPAMSEHRRLAFMRASLVTVAVASALLGALWALCTLWLSPTLRPISATPANTAVFCVGVVLFGVTTTLDYALLAAARGLVQFFRNLIASSVKLIAIPVFAAAGMTSGMAVYAAWSIGMAVSLPVCYRHFRRPAHGARFSGYRELRRVWREAVGHHVLNLALQVPTLVLPVLAALVTTPEDTARFTTARLAASFFFIIPFALPIALLAQSGSSEDDVHARIRTTLPLGIALSMGLYAVTAPFAGLLLGIFGGTYAGNSAVAAFRIMTLAGAAFVVKDHYVAVRRVEQRMSEASVVIALGTVLEIGLAVAGGGLRGIEGLCWAWLAAIVLEALAVTPAVIGMVRHAGAPRPRAGHRRPGCPAQHRPRSRRASPTAGRRTTAESSVAGKDSASGPTASRTARDMGVPTPNPRDDSGVWDAPARDLQPAGPLPWPGHPDGRNSRAGTPP
jgi:O-antigen/teichoic acid export membrane protein